MISDKRAGYALSVLMKFCEEHLDRMGVECVFCPFSVGLPNENICGLFHKHSSPYGWNDYVKRLTTEQNETSKEKEE